MLPKPASIGEGYPEVPRINKGEVHVRPVRNHLQTPINFERCVEVKRRFSQISDFTYVLFRRNANPHWLRRELHPHHRFECWFSTLITTDGRSRHPDYKTLGMWSKVWSVIRTLSGSFSAVSKPIFASKYSLESSRRDLHNALLCKCLQKVWRKFAEILRVERCKGISIW